MSDRLRLPKVLPPFATGVSVRIDAVSAALITSTSPARSPRKVFWDGSNLLASLYRSLLDSCVVLCLRRVGWILVATVLAIVRTASSHDAAELNLTRCCLLVVCFGTGSGSEGRKDGTGSFGCCVWDSAKNPCPSYAAAKETMTELLKKHAKGAEARWRGPGNQWDLFDTLELNGSLLGRLGKFTYLYRPHLPRS